MPNKLSQLLLSRTPGYALEAPFYCDPDIYQADLETIFYREWLFAIPACEIPAPGDYTTMQVGDFDILMVRGKDMHIRAFHNICRHRGFKVCRQAKGRAASLVCGYHQWTYRLDGSLASARDMGQDFDKSSFGLKPVHCKVLSGLVYICLAEAAPDFEAFANVAAPYLDVHDLTDAKIAYESEIIENGNWKLVWENNRECYHCRGNHPAICKSYSDDPDVTGIPEEDDPDSILFAHVNRLETADIAIPARFTISQTGQFRLSRAPLIKGAQSMTLSGRPASVRSLGQHLQGDEGVLMMFHYPSTWNHFMPDHSIVFRVTPITPTQTRLTTKWLVHKDAVEGQDYNIEELTHVWLSTNAEDQSLVGTSQRGVMSPAYEPGPYSPKHEEGVGQFVDWYIQAMAHQNLPHLS